MHSQTCISNQTQRQVIFWVRLKVRLTEIIFFIAILIVAQLYKNTKRKPFTWESIKLVWKAYLTLQWYYNSSAVLASAFYPCIHSSSPHFTVRSLPICSPHVNILPLAYIVLIKHVVDITTFIVLFCGLLNSDVPSFDATPGPIRPIGPTQC